MVIILSKMKSCNNAVFSIACVGDIMPGGVLHNKESKFIDSDVLNYLLHTDVRVGTLECAIGDGLAFDPEKMSRKQDIVYSPNSDLERLKEIHIDVVSIANNHIYDLGYEGLKNTIKQLDALNIKHCGAGMNLEEASQPAVVNLYGQSLAFIGFCDYRDGTVGYVPFAEADKPGINPLYEEHVLSEIKKYKKIYDYVFVIPHWGYEHTYLPASAVWNLSRRMIKAGADGILGGHTHRIQPICQLKGKYVIYSLGNFMFFDRYINAPRPTYYPSSAENTENYPITYAYPYVKEPTLKLWPYLARIGMIVKLSIGTDIKYECKPTFLGEDNSIRFYSMQEFKRINKKLTLLSWLLRTPFYPAFYYSYIYVMRIYNALRRR